jgi:hypothetical protein
MPSMLGMRRGSWKGPPMHKMFPFCACFLWKSSPRIRWRIWSESIVFSLQKENRSQRYCVFNLKCIANWQNQNDWLTLNTLLICENLCPLLCELYYCRLVVNAKCQSHCNKLYYCKPNNQSHLRVKTSLKTNSKSSEVQSVLPKTELFAKNWKE